MNLYTDDNPKTTLKGLGFKNEKTAIETVMKVEKHFELMKKIQPIPGMTPNNVLPKKQIKNKHDCEIYYERQKMYRILGMSNRAKGMLHRTKNKNDFLRAIKIFTKWMDQYKLNMKKLKKQTGGKIKSCCDDITNKKKCYRKSDGKIFDLPRRFTKERCAKGINGFTMRSSCAPFKDCF